MKTLSNSPEIVKAVFGVNANGINEDSLTSSIYEKLTTLSPGELKPCVPLFEQHAVYKEFKSRTLMVTDGPTFAEEKVFNLIAACGEHAKALKGDFRELEHWEGNEPYARARKAVLGK